MLSDQTLQFLKKDTYVVHFGDLIGGETFQVANAVLDSVEAHLKDHFLKDLGDTDVQRGHAREKFAVGCHLILLLILVWRSRQRQHLGISFRIVAAPVMIQLILDILLFAR